MKLLLLYVYVLIKVANMSKFCANLSFMFTENPFLERYLLAKSAGFKAIESGFPFGLKQEDVLNAKNKSGLEQVLINVYTGDVTKGEMGFAAIPGKEKEFRESIHQTIPFAKALGAKKIHVMAGIVPNPTKENDDCYTKNLQYAAKEFEKENILGVIEPINKYSVPNYYMNDYKKALNVIHTVNSSNLKIMFDIFHLQLIQGNLAHTIKDFAKYIGHVQVAQAPDRHEPDTFGEINYKYVFEILKEAGYNDWIGLEYKPAGNVTNGLKWIKDFGYNL